MWAKNVPSAQEGQRKVLHPLDLELQTVVNCLCVLGTKPQSSRVASALTH